jgi:restriction system protein
LRAVSTEARRTERAHAAARREAAAQEKLATAEHVRASQDEAATKNTQLHSHLEALGGVLSSSLVRAPCRFADLKVAPTKPRFEPGSLAEEEEAPELASFLPTAPHGLAALLPGSKGKYAQRVRAAEEAFEQASQAHQRRESKRSEALKAATEEHETKLAGIDEATRRHHADVDELERQFAEGGPEAVIHYFSAVLAAMAISLPYEPPEEPRVAFSPASKQLVIELELPPFEAIPEAREYRYIRTRDEITSAQMPAAERKRLYASLIAQLALRTLHEAFQADDHDVIETIVLNGHVETVDKRTGQQIHPCLVTVRATKDQFDALNLRQVDPAECLKGLNASVSRSPSELVPVRPVIEFDMADPRFVTKEDVLENLDGRPNLMELTPKEFESLITSLFEKIGLETRLTQPSRDGGVDCVAYDTRPIFGGKVVIQAKRYKNTVGVSAVRDLFGTMQNEGATKGILVTTSGYGKASHEFANGKPLELIDGGGLLYLLNEHANIDAKIEVPEDWVDPEPDA